MKNRLIALMIIFVNMIAPAYASMPKELKVGGIMFVKMIIGVIISSILIWIGLVVYKKIKNNDFAKKSPNKSTTDKCELDDAKTMEEAINTFLTLNN